MTFVFLATLLTISFVAPMILLPTASAHDPAWKIPTYAYINAAPNPVGVGQQTTIVVWIDKVLDGASVTNDIRFEDYKLTITKPDGKVETITWDTVTDTTSSAYTLYTPDQVGNYTLFFEFPGLTYTWTEPVTSLWGVTAPSAYINDVFLTSNATTTLAVQEDPIENIASTALPTEYWTRPIYGENSNWYTISSNWLSTAGGTQYGDQSVQPDGAAPSSSHIMWTKALQYGGVVGGTTGAIDGVTYYNGLLYEAKFTNSIIINGRLYYTPPESNNPKSNDYVCVNLQTGEEIWRQTYTVAPTFGQLYDFESPNQHGVIPNGYLWAVSGTTWIAYDPLDGSWLFNLTNVPSGTTRYGPNGELLIYQINTNKGWLALWNSTEAFGANMISYRPIGAIVDAKNAYSWNVTIPKETNVTGATIQAIIYDDMILGSSTLASSFTWGTTDPYTFWAISIDPDTRGSLLWAKNYAAPSGNVSRIIGVVDEDTRVFTLSEKETMRWYGYDLDTGKEIWGPTESQVAFDYYGTASNTMKAFKAYGNMYYAGYGGVLYCYDLETGKLEYSYGNGGAGNSTNSGLETAYGRYPLAIANIADGKIYVYTSEHSPNAPLYKGALVRCLNATTGAELWTMSGWGQVGVDQSWPIADGYMVYLNSYDMQLYCVGKGPSATTIQAPLTQITAGESIIVQGTVTDTAAGVAQDEQAARFPNGVACVSDDSMSGWMEYVYMQKAKPTDATGVDVTISAIDPNGNYIILGKATSDTSGLYSFAWKTPDVPGKYTVTATFAGTEGYYGSFAETAVVISEAVATPTQQPTQPPSAADLYFLPMSIAIIIAVVAIGAVLVLLLLRKHP
ncbi:MAG: hypothetical protein NWE96_06285 [Candidatus Bathyarchaeota archaeon]|nr:hypothetical protein [Candidatus Bathyarchaeota archaeon]